MSSGVTMSQNILATAFVRGRHGRMVKVVGSGRAYMSLSSERTNPSIADPSKPMPRVRALSSSSTVTETPFSPPKYVREPEAYELDVVIPGLVQDEFDCFRVSVDHADLDARPAAGFLLR